MACQAVWTETLCSDASLCLKYHCLQVLHQVSQLLTLLTPGRALMTYVVPKCHLEHDSITRPACSCKKLRKYSSGLQQHVFCEGYVQQS